jgi:hypothetical protein
MDLKERGWMWTGFMWHTVRATGCLSVNQVIHLKGSKIVVNLTRQGTTSSFRRILLHGLTDCRESGYRPEVDLFQ